VARARLLLVGLVHRDPRGLGPLFALLARERADQVTIEISPLSLRFRQKRGVRLRARLLSAARRLPPGAPLREEAREVADCLALPYEFRAARAYGRRSGAPVLPLDLSFFARPRIEALERWAEEVLERARAGVAASPVFAPLRRREDGARRELARARAILSGAVRPLPLSPDEARELSLRDAHAARRLRSLLAERPRARIVHLAGWEHIEDGALPRLLSDLAPRRLLFDPCAT
jgi:hypothetical protein